MGKTLYQAGGIVERAKQEHPGNEGGGTCSALPARTIVEHKQAGQTGLLVEQNVKMALAVAHDAYVIRQGEIVLDAGGGVAHQQGAFLRLSVATRNDERPDAQSRRIAGAHYLRLEASFDAH